MSAIAALGRRGIAGLVEVRAARARTAIFVMGVVESESFAREAVRHGAVGRVLKDMPPSAMPAAIHAAARRPARLRVVRRAD